MHSLDISRLELVKQLELEQLKMHLYKLYGIEIETMEPSENGAGGLTYFVSAGEHKYVVKYPSENDMNHPEVEVRVCSKLLEKGIPACRFLSNRQGKMLSTDENGRRFTVQEYYEGTTYGYYETPVEFQREAAIMLARIHNAMEDLDGIPMGIGEDFFRYRKPESMQESYQETLQRTQEEGNTLIQHAHCGKYEGI